jgi:hypothetical protein
MAVRNDFTAGEVLAAADLNDTFAAKLNLAGGKVLQIVRATDTTSRTTTSTSFVDASISVTITPQKNDSAVLLLWVFQTEVNTNNTVAVFTITDNSNNSISGGEQGRFLATGSQILTQGLILARATPATTSAVTYKGRFASNDGGTVRIRNDVNTGQLYAIEVSA